MTDSTERRTASLQRSRTRISPACGAVAAGLLFASVFDDTSAAEWPLRLSRNPRISYLELPHPPLALQSAAGIDQSPSQPPDSAAPPLPPAPSVVREEAGEQPTAMASMEPTVCAPLSELEAADRDGDVRRNRELLSSQKLCLKQETFQEGPLRWHLQIIQNKDKPGSVLWLIPHDNENTAFDAAVYGISTHGGTLVAVETGGSRYLGRQDPNRNFDAGLPRRCSEQIARSPEYTRRVLRWRIRPEMPIIALHNNERGYSGDGQGGGGGISMAKELPGARGYRAQQPFTSLSPDDTMVFVASSVQRDEDPALSAFVSELTRRGIHVMYETVSTNRNDCSLSNYAALMGLRSYVNIEVVHSDISTQRRMVDVIVPLLDQHIGPLPSPAMTSTISPRQEPQAPAPPPRREQARNPVPQPPPAATNVANAARDASSEAFPDPGPGERAPGPVPSGGQPFNMASASPETSPAPAQSPEQASAASSEAVASVQPGTTTPSPPAPPGDGPELRRGGSQPSNPRRSFAVRLHRDTSEDGANAALREYQGQLRDNTLVLSTQSVTEDGTTAYLVVAGPFASRNRALQWCERIGRPKNTCPVHPN